MTKLGVFIVALSLAACAHDNGFKKASPQRMAETNMQLAIEYMKMGKLAESRDRIEHALQQDDNNPNVQMTAGIVYERLREPAKAEKAYAAAYRLGKKDPNVIGSYAGYLCRSGKAVEGEKLFVEVAESPVYLTPEVAYTNAGVCARGTGDLVDAERYFNHALAIKPNLPEAMLQLGNIAFDRGDSDQARELVQRYLSLNKPTPEVLWLGFRAERKLGDSVAAATYARRVQTEFPDSEQALMMRAGVGR